MTSKKKHQQAAIEKLGRKIGTTIIENNSEKAITCGAWYTRVKGDVISLTLAGLNLESIPTELGDLPELNVLDLSKNKLLELPPVLQKLSKLAILKLNNNQLYSLPEWLGNMKVLKNLSLANNNLRSLPESMGTLTLLRQLFLQGNDLQRLPYSLTNLKLLAEIHLDFRTAMKKNVKAVLTALEANDCYVNAHYNRR